MHPIGTNDAAAAGIGSPAGRMPSQPAAACWRSAAELRAQPVAGCSSCRPAVRPHKQSSPPASFEQLLSWAVSVLWARAGLTGSRPRWQAAGPALPGCQPRPAAPGSGGQSALSHQQGHQTGRRHTQEYVARAQEGMLTSRPRPSAYATSSSLATCRCVMRAPLIFCAAAERS